LITKATSNYLKRRDTLIKNGVFTKEKYHKTIKVFKTNPRDLRLKSHKIDCKKNQTIISIAIINTQNRILINQKNCDEKIFVFSWIGKHREYEKIIKDKKNCKKLFLNCEELSKLQEIEK